MNADEIRSIMAEVQRDHVAFPVEVKRQQLHDAGWISHRSGAIWLPPSGTSPYRPYQLYSGWKQMRKVTGAE